MISVQHALGIRYALEFKKPWILGVDKEALKLTFGFLGGNMVTSEAAFGFPGLP